MKKRDFASMFTKRADGRFVASYTENGRRRFVYDRDPECLYKKMQELADRSAAPATFEDIARAWFDAHAPAVGFKTAEGYAAPMRRAIEEFGAAPASSVTPAEISSFLRRLADCGYARRTVQLQRDVLSMIFDHAIVYGSGDVTVNPCASVSMPRNLKTSKRTLPPDEALAAVVAGFSMPFGRFAALCLLAGLRRGEALALRHEDLDRVNKTITVSRAVEFVGNQAQLKTPKTDAGTRVVVLLDALAELIPEGHGLIVCNPDGSLLSKTQYRRRWSAFCASIGCELTAHQLRHGFATFLFEAGVSERDAMEMLGHSSIAITHDRYTHIRLARKLEAAAKLEAYVVTSVVKTPQTPTAP